MKNFIRDLFKTKQPDGTYAWDATNPAFSVAPWLLGILVYVGLGAFRGVTHADFSLMDYSTGLAALFAGGGIGVMFHSRSQN